MSIPASLIVSITPRIISAGGSGLEINGLFLTENELLPVGAVASFVSASAVRAYFGTESDEYSAAAVYFAGYNNSFKKPSALNFARRVSAPASAFLRGAKFAGTLDSLKTVDDGGFKITVDGSAASVADVDLASATSFSDVAAKIQTALSIVSAGVKIAYSSLTGGFQINSGSTGEDSAVSFASAPASGSDLSTLLNLTESSGAIISIGSAVILPITQMDLIVEQTANWATFGTIYEAGSAEAIALNAWSMSKGVNYLYFPWSMEATALLPDSDNDLASVMKEASSTNFAPIFGDFSQTAAAMGIWASVDWNRTGGSIDIAFKNVAGVGITCSSESDAVTLDKKGYNYFGSFASRNDAFTFFYKGTIVGDYNFMSSYVNAIWLNNSIQLALLNGLSGIGKLPYNDGGYIQIRSWINDPVASALNNGVIQTGVELSSAQKSQLIVEVGGDISQDLYANGYYMQVLDPGTEARAAGASPVINLWYTDGGGVKKLSVASTAIL